MSAAAGPVLRDIHLPPAPGWWPPAPGWWLLGALAVAAALWLLHRWRRRRRVQRERELLQQAWQRALDTHPSEREPAALVAALSLLLRRSARRHAPHALALQGEPWLAFLDGADAARPFQQGPGRLLLDGPWRPQVAPDQAQALAELVRERLQRFVAVDHA
jgi:hypothetical protein